MADEDPKRKLTTILHADVVGYSRLMGDDEKATFRTLTKYRGIISDLVDRNNGRVNDSLADSVLAEFSSTVDSVRCAVAIQNQIKIENAQMPENRKMWFRVGINLAEIEEEGDTIYGYGVNIASRVESLAETGGICISGAVYEQVKNRLSFDYEYIGKQPLKNIAEPVPIFRVQWETAIEAADGPKERGKKLAKWRRAALPIMGVIAFGAITLIISDYYLRSAFIPAESASVEKEAAPAGEEALSLREKPSVAVLPFVNLSGNPDYEPFCDALTDQIITGLSSVPHLSVIASNSVFTYKGRPTRIQQVAEEFGVQHVLEGSVQRSGEDIRINAQLIDATTGRHIWAETYDKPNKDPFEVQDEITRHLITLLQELLTEGEYARVIAKSTVSLEALKYFWRAEFEYLGGDNGTAQRWAEKAITVDPEFAGGWAVLGFAHMSQGQLRSAEECARKALSIDNLFPKAWSLLGFLVRRQGDYDGAVNHLEKAVSISPNDHHMAGMLASVLLSAGRFEEAVSHLDRAIRINPNPRPPLYQLSILCAARYFLKQYEDAIVTCEQTMGKCLKEGVAPIWPHFYMAAVYSEIGQQDEARSHIAEILRLYPTYSWANWVNMQSGELSADMERLRDAVLSAGLPLVSSDSPEISQ